MSNPSLFGGIVGRGAASEAVDGRAWLRALLDVEAGLARASAKAGLAPVEAAETISRACADTGRFDLAWLAAEAAASANPVVPLVRAIEANVDTMAAAWVHFGATSQDVLDCASMLVARRATAFLVADLSAAADAAAGHATAHRDTPMAGRTLMSVAVPTTFGLKSAGWMAGLDGAGARLLTVAADLPVQYAGAVGSLSASGGHGVAIREALAAELDLRVQPLAWHTMRLPIADLAGALGAAAGVVASVAVDVVLLAQSEVGEVREGVTGRGGSSAMPHKRNSVASVSARASAHRVPFLVASLLAGMEQEHERAAGSWQAEWETLSDVFRAAGSAAAWLRDCLEHLQVDTSAMRRSAQRAADGALGVELASALGPVLGRSQAHDLVAACLYEAADLGHPVHEVLARRLEERGAADVVHLPAARDIESHLGEAAQEVDAALAAHRATGPGS